MQIFNKKKKTGGYYMGDRQLLRDKRLSADAKNIYFVLSSLAETCENVCPGYFWLASEIGYNTENKTEQAVFKWIKSKIDELSKINLINQIRKDRGYDYEVYDYIPTQQKCLVTLNKNVESPLNKNVDLETREEKQDYSTPPISEKSKTEQILEEAQKNPNWVRNQNEKFPLLTQEDIELTISNALSDNHQLKFNSILNWLEIENTKKQRREREKAKPTYTSFQSNKNSSSPPIKANFYDKYATVIQ